MSSYSTITTPHGCTQDYEDAYSVPGQHSSKILQVGTLHMKGCTIVLLSNRQSFETLPMGSYLTIVNNTPDSWQCKVGPDMAALKITGILVGVIGTVMTTLAITGASLSLISITALPFAALGGAGIAITLPFVAVGTFITSFLGVSLMDTAIAYIAIGGLPVSALVLSSVTATSISGASAVVGLAGTIGAGMAGLAGITTFGIAVGEAFQEKFHIKGYDTILPGQSHHYGRMALSLWQQGICRRTIISGPYVIVSTLIMRPIFSGSTINSNRDHEIQYWISKRGFTSEYVIEGRSGNKKRRLKDDDERIQHFGFYRNGKGYKG